HSALTPPSGAPIVSLAMRRVLVGAAAIVTSLGWLQLAAAFGFPVTAPAAMLDRMLGAQREAGPAGWVLLLLGEAALAAAYFLVVEPRTRGVVAPIAYGLGAWLLSGAVLMPIVGLIQGAPPAGDAPNDPMRATFFMLNLGPGAAVESLVAWLLFGAVLGPHAHIAGFVLDVSGTATMAIAGKGTVDVGPGDAVFTANLQRHDHENRAAVPAAIVLAGLLIILTVVLVAGAWHRRAAL